MYDDSAKGWKVATVGAGAASPGVKKGTCNEVGLDGRRELNEVGLDGGRELMFHSMPHHLYKHLIYIR